MSTSSTPIPNDELGSQVEALIRLARTRKWPELVLSFKIIIDHLHDAYPRLTPEKPSLNDEWDQYEILTPHVLMIEKIYQKFPDLLKPSKMLITILSNAACYLFESSQLKGAMKLAETAEAAGEAFIEFLRYKDAEANFAVTMVHRTRGGIHLDINEPLRAATSWKRQLRIMEELSSSDPILQLGLANARSHIALAHIASGAANDLPWADIELQHAKKLSKECPSNDGKIDEAFRLYVEGLWEEAEGCYGEVRRRRGDAEDHYKTAIDKLHASLQFYDQERTVYNHMDAL